jgi:hypothetical protein
VRCFDSGCCGLAGNFGFQPGHLQVSVDCAERVLLPRLRESAVDTVVVADGFSCRTQIHQLDSGGREGVHLAEVLAAALHDDPAPPGQPPERAYDRRPTQPPAAASLATLAAGAAAVTALAAGAAAVTALARWQRASRSARRRER